MVPSSFTPRGTFDQVQVLSSSSSSSSILNIPFSGLGCTPRITSNRFHPDYLTPTVRDRHSCYSRGKSPLCRISYCYAQPRQTGLREGLGRICPSPSRTVGSLPSGKNRHRTSWYFLVVGKGSPLLIRGNRRGHSSLRPLCINRVCSQHVTLVDSSHDDPCNAESLRIHDVPARMRVEVSAADPSTRCVMG